MEGAADRLSLVKADMLDFSSIATAVAGCEGVFHVASPVPFGPCSDPEVIFILLGNRGLGSSPSEFCQSLSFKQWVIGMSLATHEPLICSNRFCSPRVVILVFFKLKM